MLRDRPWRVFSVVAGDRSCREGGADDEYGVHVLVSRRVRMRSCFDGSLRSSWLPIGKKKRSQEDDGYVDSG
jgi:hypothetical protein